MAGYQEVPIELDEETYEAIIELLGTDDENDIKRFIVKLLTEYAENEGYVDDEYNFSDDD